MKHLLIIGFSVLFFFAAYTAIKPTGPTFSNKTYQAALLKKQTAKISCVPDWSSYYLSNEEIQQMIPLPGTGSHTWKIKVKKDSAQFYFDQGMNLYYGFHITEALPSFKKAQLFDSTAAMLYWAEALAYGPNINDFGYSASPSALTAIKKATALSGELNDKEKGLIGAMQVRYSADTLQKRAVLNQQYADKMKTLFDTYPSDPEVGALYADALMLQHPWDLWQNNGKPQLWTPLIQRLLETILKISPEHPGANHYYIHTMEASPFAFKAKASADRLGRLAPGLAHMVHMPSHIYIRTGEYKKGVAVNKEAVADYLVYRKLYPGVADNAGLYEIHNGHMQAACSLNGNDYKAAADDAIACRNCIDTAALSMQPPMGGFVQYVYMTPEIAMVNFKKWKEILAQKPIEDKYHYAALIQQFARGMAYANTGNIAAAKSSLTNLRRLLNEKDLEVVLVPFNAPLSSGKIAEDILGGTIAEKENKTEDALQHYRTAVSTEDLLVYNEPRDWLLSARHFYGNALLSSGKYKEAEKVFRKDLTVQPGNAIATAGLANTLKKLKK